MWWALWALGTLRGAGIGYRDSTDEITGRAYGEVRPLLVCDAAVVGAAIAGALAVRAVTAVQVERTRGAHAQVAEAGVG